MLAYAVCELVPYIGNFISEGDDIGEPLTDNADGNTEGTQGP